jgi:thiamine-phosphate pyrophosphorylase
MSASERAALPRLLAITDLGLLPAEVLLARLRRLAVQARPGTLALVLRDHGKSALERLTLGKQLLDVARGSGQALWVADRLDLALLLEADGVHLGEGSVSAAVARRLVGDAVRISRAWHQASLIDSPTAEELAQVDALLVSPVLAPRKGRPALGLAPLGVLGEQLRARNWACQLYALGGVSAENASACRQAGALGVAAIGAALAEDPSALLAALDMLR